MLSKFISCLILLGCAYTVFGVQWQTEPYQHPEYLGQCYDKEVNEPVPVGNASSNRKGCKVQFCQPDFSFKGSSCAAMGVPPPNCKVTEPDFSLHYPECCPRPIC